ncbi:MAG: hypothetical protein ACI4XL_01935 [Bacillus sp. (in: firmicutes)]
MKKIGMFSFVLICLITFAQLSSAHVRDPLALVPSDPYELTAEDWTCLDMNQQTFQLTLSKLVTEAGSHGFHLQAAILESPTEMTVRLNNNNGASFQNLMECSSYDPLLRALYIHSAYGEQGNAPVITYTDKEENFITKTEQAPFLEGETSPCNASYQ